MISTLKSYKNLFHKNYSARTFYRIDISKMMGLILSIYLSNVRADIVAKPCFVGRNFQVLEFGICCFVPQHPPSFSKKTWCPSCPSFNHLLGTWLCKPPPNHVLTQLCREAYDNDGRTKKHQWSWRKSFSGRFRSWNMTMCFHLCIGLPLGGPTPQFQMSKPFPCICLKKRLEKVKQILSNVSLMMI